MSLCEEWQSQTTAHTSTKTLPQTCATRSLGTRAPNHWLSALPSRVTSDPAQGRATAGSPRNKHVTDKCPAFSLLRE